MSIVAVNLQKRKRGRKSQEWHLEENETARFGGGLGKYYVGPVGAVGRRRVVDAVGRRN